MTLPDRIAEAIIERGPMPECHIATTVRKRKDVVSAELEGNPDRFVHNGLKARASRWDVREAAADVVVPSRDDNISPANVPTFATDELAARWERGLKLDSYTAMSFVSYWVERGLLESTDGNGRVRVTELGRQKSEAWNALGVRA